MLDPLDDLELPENLRKRIVVGEVVRELARAQRRFGPFASPHELAAMSMRLMHDCTHADDRHGGWRR